MRSNGPPKRSSRYRLTASGLLRCLDLATTLTAFTYSRLNFVMLSITTCARCAVLLSCFALPSQAVKAADAKVTIDWLEKVSDVWLQYHCLIRFGKTKSVFSEDPGRIQDKWQAVFGLAKDNNIDLGQVDRRVQLLMAARCAYELQFQKSWKSTAKSYYAFLGTTAVSVIGGQPIDEILQTCRTNIH